MIQVGQKQRLKTKFFLTGIATTKSVDLRHMWFRFKASQLTFSSNSDIINSYRRGMIVE